MDIRYFNWCWIFLFVVVREVVEIERVGCGGDIEVLLDLVYD